MDGKGQTLQRVLEKTGRACRDARVNAGVSLLGMAGYLQADKSTISRFEHGQINSLWIFLGYVDLMGHSNFRTFMSDMSDFIWEEAQKNG